jgi:hypothetical protein
LSAVCFAYFICISNTEEHILIQLKQPYLLFLGDAADQLAAKTADGIARWRPEWCVGQLRLANCNADIGLPDMTLEEARQAGAQTLVAGVANRGGTISDIWRETLLQAVDLGYDIASGLHARLGAIDGLAERAAQRSVQLSDVRYTQQTFAVGNGVKRTGKRLLTVGTDCSVGKMFTALAMEQEMKARGLSCTFRASGQTGIFIAGEGVSVDAVVSDFVSGALGSSRGTGLALSRLVCRCVTRFITRFTTRLPRTLPRPGPPTHARFAHLRPAEHSRLHSSQRAVRPLDQRPMPYHRHRRQHF